MSRGPLASAFTLVVLLGIAIAGLPALQIDGLRAFALPPDHPLIELNQALDERTGGDDVLIAAVFAEPDGTVFEPGPLDAIDAVRGAIQRVPTLSGARDIVTAPVLAEQEGAVTAITPLSPRPEGAALRAAGEVVLADPFIADQLVARSGAVALVVAWIERGGDDMLLGRRADVALATDLGQSEVGGSIRDEINGARMAVALGEVETSAPVEVASRLRALAARGGPAGDVVASMVDEASLDAADPAARSLSQLRAELKGTDLSGVRVELVGPQVTTEALSLAVAGGVRSGLVGLLLFAALAVGWRRRAVGPAVAAAVAPALAAGAGLGLCGLLGVPMHLPTALAGLVGALWAGAVVSASSVGPVPLVRLTIVGLIGAAAWGAGLGDAGAALAPAACLLSGCVAAGVMLPTVTVSSGEVEAQQGTPWTFTLYVAAAAGVAGTLALSSVPMGLDVGGLLRDRAPEGATSRFLAEELGTAPAAFLVMRAEEPPRALARPSSLRALRMGQASLEQEPVVAGTISWADFVSRLHERVSGAEPGLLPTTPALVDQYLLAFGRPKQTRVLVAEDLSLGVAMVRLVPGGAARLGLMVERTWPAGEQPLALAGDAAAMTLAARRSSRGIAKGAAAGLLLLALLFASEFGSSRRFLTDLFVVAGAGLIACGTAAALLGAIAPTACAAGVIAGLLGWLARRCEAGGAPAAGIAALGVTPLLLSSSLQLHAFGAGLATAAVLLAVCRLGERPVTAVAPSAGETLSEVV